MTVSVVGRRKRRRARPEGSRRAASVFLLTAVSVPVPAVAVAVLEALAEETLVERAAPEARAVVFGRVAVVALVREVEALVALAVAATLLDAVVVTSVERRLPELLRAAPAAVVAPGGA